MANKPKKELGGPRQMSTGTKVVIAVFAVIMALSMTLPSLAPIFANSFADDEQTTEQDDSTEEKKDEEESSDEEALAGVPDNDSLKDLAKENYGTAKKYEERLNQEPNNLAALLNLGQTYMNWGYSAQYSGTTDEEKEYSNGLLNKALECFDRYLAIEESNAVRVQRLSCQYYLGNTQESLDAMRQMTEQNPDYPLAWAHLGLFYEWQYDYDNAKAAYKKASENDPNNEYGVKDFAEEHITSIEQSTANFDDLTNEELLGTKSKPQDGLPGIIANNSGL